MHSSGWHGGLPGTHGAELIPRLAAIRDAAAHNNTARWHFVGKPTYSCLHDTPMRHALARMQIDELYVMGINTEQCVFATMFDAWRDHAVNRVYIVADATASSWGD